MVIDVKDLPLDMQIDLFEKGVVPYPQEENLGYAVGLLKVLSGKEKLPIKTVRKILELALAILK